MLWLRIHPHDTNRLIRRKPKWLSVLSQLTDTVRSPLRYFFARPPMNSRYAPPATKKPVNQAYE